MAPTPDQPPKAEGASAETPDNSSTPRGPAAWLMEAARRLPLMQYAIGVVGVSAAAAISVGFSFGDSTAAIYGAVAVIALMVVLKRLSETAPNSRQLELFTWAIIVAFIAVLGMGVVKLGLVTFGNGTQPAPESALGSPKTSGQNPPIAPPQSPPTAVEPKPPTVEGLTARFKLTYSVDPEDSSKDELLQGLTTIELEKRDIPWKKLSFPYGLRQTDPVPLPREGDYVVSCWKNAADQRPTNVELQQPPQRLKPPLQYERNVNVQRSERPIDVKFTTGHQVPAFFSGG